MNAIQLFTRSGREQAPTTAINGAPAYSYRDSCSRCGGAGGADKWAHTGWKCFQCDGSGNGPVRVERLYTAEKLEKLNAAQAKRDAAKAAAFEAAQAARAAERAARRAEFLERNAEFLARLGSLDGEFFTGLYEQMVERAYDPTERQVEVVNAEIARRAAKAASAFTGAPGERVTLVVTTDKVIDITPEPRPYGYSRRFMFLARDASGNRIVYRGSGAFPGEGEQATVKVTIAEHTVYRDEKQTVVQRPKLLDESLVAA